MNKFKTYYNEEQERDYYAAIALLENNALNEFSFSGLKDGIKSKIEFFKTLAEYSGKKIDDVLKLAKDSRVYKFFSSLDFSLDSLFTLVKTGFKVYGELADIIAEYISKTKIAKWTEEALKDLDKYLESHPYVKRLAGPAVAGLLLYIWFTMANTGDADYDFDFTDIIKAATGTFSIAALFAGKDGIKMLLLLIAGLKNFAFPWPLANSSKFVLALINGLRKLV